MQKGIMMACIFALIIPAGSQAGEELRSISFLHPDEQRSIQCKMGSTVTEDFDRSDRLKCWEIKKGKRGRLVYELVDHRYADALSSITPSLLLSAWESGTVSCYQAIDFTPKEPRVILGLDMDECSKARMEIVYGQKSEVAFLLEKFDGGTSRGESKVFCWKSGKLTTQIVPWQKRFEWLQEHCWE
jgi:hypothetical protein